eukprot:TRINITY_DN10198_c0_g1_i1.p1 TRINITY_DN10198_c0_g1~~TRINITY_DN10198_c0_g1_i1.p1  ORF type:complete len:278 (-),score=60.87 TRINITY_DN10198_c0_g1_i1:379-1212(-)
MFAYMLMLYLFRTLNVGPFKVVAALDAGFTMFTVFCIASTLASLAIPEPRSGAAMQDAERPRQQSSSPSSAYLAFFCIVVFVGTFGYGLVTPCMSVRLDPHLLTEPTGPVPKRLGGVVTQLTKQWFERPNDVSVMQCIFVMYQWGMETGEFNCLLSSLVLFVFVVLLTFLDVALLFMAACRLLEGMSHRDRLCLAMADASKRVNRVAMLDVLVMGLLVVNFAGASFNKLGVSISLEPGFTWLSLAALAHGVAAMLVGEQRKLDAEDASTTEAIMSAK